MAKQKPGISQLNVKMAERVADDWGKWVDESGYLKGRATAAALKLFQLVPADIRDKLMRGDEEPVRLLFLAAKASSYEEILEEMRSRMNRTIEEFQLRPGGAKRKAGGGKG